MFHVSKRWLLPVVLLCAVVAGACTSLDGNGAHAASTAVQRQAAIMPLVQLEPHVSQQLSAQLALLDFEAKPPRLPGIEWMVLSDNVAPKRFASAELAPQQLVASPVPPVVDLYEPFANSATAFAAQTNNQMPIDSEASEPAAQVANNEGEPQLTPPPDAAPAYVPPQHSGTWDDWLNELRSCEASGGYDAYNPAGPYMGAYQFDQSTWDGVASRHAPELVGVNPNNASPAQQDAMAIALASERGRQPWPVCGPYWMP